MFDANMVALSPRKMKAIGEVPFSEFVFAKISDVLSEGGDARLNFDVQNYKGIPIRLIDRSYKGYNAKRYVIISSADGFQTNQNIWIPCKHLEEDGTIKLGENLDYIFLKAKRQLELAGWMMYFKPIGG
jgi:hypothetical protein